MKTQKQIIDIARHIMIMAFLFVAVILSMNLQAEDYTKSYKEKYEIDKGALLAIQNKFGDINCQTWKENSVSVTVTIKVDAGSQEKANKVFDKISVSLSGSRSKITGVTTVGNISNADFSIDYDILMPEWINLDLNNKFGDITLDENTGVTKINLEYGSMQANAFNGNDNQFVIKFSDVNVEFVNTGKINIEYGEWKSAGVENLTVYSRFSSFKIEKSSILNVDSQYDDINIASTGQVIAVSRFSDLEFEKITAAFDFDLEYGELEIDYISADFRNGKVRNTFADTEMGFDPNSSFQLDAEVKFGDLSYPKSAGSVSKETIGYTTNIYKGNIGSASGVTSTLDIISKNASTRISFVE